MRKEFEEKTNNVINFIYEYITRGECLSPLIIESLFKENNAIIFGGFIRDYLTGSPINDMDVILPKQFNHSFMSILKLLHFDNKDDDVQTQKDNVNDILYYEQIGFTIHETMVYKKYKVQLINPVKELADTPTKADYFCYCYEFAKRVDLSNCGVFWSYYTGIMESVFGALEDIQNKKMRRTEYRDFLLDSTGKRIKKFERLGWELIRK